MSPWAASPLLVLPGARRLGEAQQGVRIPSADQACSAADLYSNTRPHPACGEPISRAAKSSQCQTRTHSLLCVNSVLEPAGVSHCARASLREEPPRPGLGEGLENS